MMAPPGLFAATAAYYGRFRAPYAQEAIDFIVKRYDFCGRTRALDLGCGPGTISIPISYASAEVIAVDQGPDMIAEGQRRAASQGRRNIKWLRSRAEDIQPELAPFQATTIGQAFHWMNRDEVLRKLATLIADGGGVALVNPGKRRPQESWEPVANEIIAKFLGSEPAIRNPTRKNLNTSPRWSGQNASPNSQLMSSRAPSRGT